MILSEQLLIEGTNKDGIIENVKILGFTSKNNRTYTPTAIKNAVNLYEGVQVYFDHASTTSGRLVKDRFGKLKNVRYTDDGLRGDLEYLTSHPCTAMVLEDLTRKTGYFGLSHVADGNYKRNKEGVQVVESIEKVLEVDLVSNPATTNSLTEQTITEEAVKEVVAPDYTKLTEQVNSLVEQVATLKAELQEVKKPKKYITNQLVEQVSNEIPVDADSLKKWFYKG